MRKYLLVAVSTAAMSFSSQAVLAADVLAPVDPGYDWSGPYVGLQGGWSWGDVDYDIPAYAPEPPDGDVDGLVLGGYAGYNMQAMYGMVWGVEIGGNWRDVDGSDPTVAVVGEEFVTDQEWDASAVIHVGLPMDNFMFYGLGGGTVTEITGQYDPGFSDESDTVWGWTVGAGLEGAITETFHARLEYRYADYGKADLTCSTLRTYRCGPDDPHCHVRRLVQLVG